MKVLKFNLFIVEEINKKNGSKNTKASQNNSNSNSNEIISSTPWYFMCQCYHGYQEPKH